MNTSNSPVVQINHRPIGAGQPTYIIAEIGINHNGQLDIARELMKIASEAGCDAVKFQKRTPAICVPVDQQTVPRETPWGVMSYLEYKERTEFGATEYDLIDKWADEFAIDWFASPWDVPSVKFLETYDPICYKVASACLTDEELLKAIAATRRPVILSTGMSTMDEIRQAVGWIGNSPLLIAHATSTYPCSPDQLNLRTINSLAAEFSAPIGYSGHETGLQTTVAAVAIGASFVERHITLDRAMWGSDHAASVEPAGLNRLVRDIRIVEAALGDGRKRVYESEIPLRQKLRRIH